MPFSSPIGEEVLSPTSPNLQRSPRWRRNGPWRDNVAEKPSTQARRFSVQKPLKAASPRKPSKSPNRTHLPELNVVTNFSKPPILAKRAADALTKEMKDASASTDDWRAMDASQIHHEKVYRGQKRDKASFEKLKRGDRLGKSSRSSIEYRDAEAMLEDAAGLGLHRLGDSRTTLPSAQSTKGPVNDLRRASSKAIELSPSDRLIAIGITITPTSLVEPPVSANINQERSPGLLVQQHASHQGSPAAPSIVVTPAKEIALWSTPVQQYTAYRPRPASSVYSQATHRGRAATQPTPIPPVPLLIHPPNHSRGNTSESAISSNQDIPASRVVSGCTIFEDEDSPPMKITDRVHPAGPELRLLTRTSTDTIATKRRSQGWWNYLLSPFSAKPNEGFDIFRNGIQGLNPDSPQSSEATRIGEDSEILSQKKDELSPVTVISSGPESRHTSIWTDTSDFESRRGPIGLAFDHTPHASEIVRDWPREIIGNDLSDLPTSPEGFGAAAEYYQACWHDQDSPTPYFECQNHTCLPLSNVGSTANTRLLKGQQALGSISEEAGDKSLVQPGLSVEPQGPGSKSPEKLKPTVFQQTPANRFSAAFKEEIDSGASKGRPLSENIIIEDLDDTPAIEEAHAAPIVRAMVPAPAPIAHSSPKSIALNTKPQEIPESKPSSVPGTDQPARGLPGRAESHQPLSPPRAADGPSQEDIASPQRQMQAPQASAPPRLGTNTMKRFIAVMPPDFPSNTPEQQQPPILTSSTPERQTGVGANEVPITSDVSGNDARPVYIVNHYHGSYQPRPPVEQTAMTDFYPPPRAAPDHREKPAAKMAGKGTAAAKKKSRGCLTSRRRRDRSDPEKKTKKRCLLIAIAVGLVLLIVLILALALTLTRKGDDMPVQSQWLNITGFPPVPTGISTIIQPDASREQSGCVAPTTLWSCALPKEDQTSVKPNDIDQPNFRVEIRFQNGTNVSQGINASLTKRSLERAPNAVSATRLVRHHLLRLRDSFSDALFTPSPAPPSLEEQAFLGNSTDEIAAPFSGEITPFYMSFHSAQKLSTSRLIKRALDRNASVTNTTDPFPDVIEGIPPPENDPDGTAASANLLPFPSAQPLRLFNRGLPTEHYGFYTYFDRSIFLKSTALVDDSQATGVVPDDEDGGAEESAATVRCTWTQTRFLVQIWTNKGGTASLLSSNNATASQTDDKNPSNLTASSANDFDRPGSFPYPVSITLDRHGGDIKTKVIYCYGMDSRRHIISDQKKLQLEDRAFGGHLVNPALGPFGNVNVSISEGGPGGIDGGTGGCSCLWKNWNGADA